MTCSSATAPSPPTPTWRCAAKAACTGSFGLIRSRSSTSVRTVVTFRPDESGATAKGRPRSRWVKRLGQDDQLVEYQKPKSRPAWLSAEEYAALPANLLVRELRYRVHIPGRRTRQVTLVTTLLDPKRYPAQALAKLYGLRWRAEVDLKHLKQTLGMDVLRSKTVPGVMKELLAFAIVYNLVRRVMHAAARRQKVAPSRISFIDAWRWLRQARPGDEPPALACNPERVGRFEPRVRKRRPKQYPLMKHPRAELRQAILTQKLAA
jgi:IS4 transposase